MAAFIFLVPPTVQNTKANLSHRKKKKKEEEEENKKITPTALKEEVPKEAPEKMPEKTPIEEEKPSQKEIKSPKKKVEENIVIEKDSIKPTLYTLMLLMDKESSYTILIEAIETHHIGTVINQEDKESIEIQMASEVMELRLLKLSRHTSKLTLKTRHHTQEAKKIITYLKEKENDLF